MLVAVWKVETRYPKYWYCPDVHQINTTTLAIRGLYLQSEQ